MSVPILEMVQLEHALGLPLPSYETADAAGMDLRAAVGEAEPIIVEVGQRALIPTGLIMAIPSGFEGQVRPRSGLALKHGITCLNAPGTIDADYRGEVNVLLINHGDAPFEITRGMRIAQLVIAAVTQARVGLSETKLNATERGVGGFGSTGTD
ncbi:MAG: dUTP diphosphatase [Pseudomonadota bacterium]